MTIQQNKKSRSARDIYRSHNALESNALSAGKSTGEVHPHHHVSPDGSYRDCKVVDKGSDEQSLSAPITAIDVMGGDLGPRCVVPVSIAFLTKSSYSQLILIGQPALLEELLSRYSSLDRQRLHVHTAGEVIGSDECPSQALRGKPDASMRVALELVRGGQTHTCVSAGNTEALMALSRHLLKALPGIDRPAMVTVVPTEKGHCHLLDLGANVGYSAEHFYQFAVMGAVATEALGCTSPRVALLNVGIEETKGNQQVKLATSLLQRAQGLNFSGYVEGNGLHRGKVDVVVCDGFIGNILLKANEDLVAMVSARIEQRFHNGLAAKLVGALALPLLRWLRGDIAPARYNGASFFGLQGVVVKSHGSAAEEGFQSALRRAALEVRENLPQRLHGRLGHPLL